MASVESPERKSVFRRELERELGGPSGPTQSEGLLARLKRAGKALFFGVAKPSGPVCRARVSCRARCSAVGVRVRFVERLVRVPFVPSRSVAGRWGAERERPLVRSGRPSGGRVVGPVRCGWGGAAGPGVSPALLDFSSSSKGERKIESHLSDRGTIARGDHRSEHQPRSSDGPECRNRTAEPSGTLEGKASHGWR
jgi:hypothetical protein